MAASIVPVAKTIYLCDHVLSMDIHGAPKTDVMGLVNAIRVLSFPHVAKRFHAFAQLTSGLGLVPFVVRIKHAATDAEVYRSPYRTLRFPTRSVVLHMSLAINDCVFPWPGLYLAELYCNNQWVADTTLLLH